MAREREFLSASENASLSFLSALDPGGSLDAALFLRMTGSVLAAWSRENIPMEVVSVMSATMLASAETIVESLGGPPTNFVSVDAGDRRMIATRVNGQTFLIVIASQRIGRAYLRRASAQLAARLAAASTVSLEAAAATARSDMIVKDGDRFLRIP